MNTRTVQAHQMAQEARELLIEAVNSLELIPDADWTKMQQNDRSLYLAMNNALDELGAALG